MTKPTAPALPVSCSFTPAQLSPEDARKVAEVLAPFKPRQQDFIRAVVAGQTPQIASKAAGYRGVAKLTSKRLMADPAIAKAIEDVRAIVANRVLYDFEQAHQTLMEGLYFAQKTGNANAAVRAGELLAKLHGHLTDRVDVSAAGNVAFIFPDFRKPATGEGVRVIEATDHAPSE